MYGINLSGSNNNEIFLNYIENNHGYGIYLEDSYENDIYYNNLMNNEEGNAFFSDSANYWYQNYWGEPGGFIKIIWGTLTFLRSSIPWPNFDIFPAKRRYELPL